MGMLDKMISLLLICHLAFGKKFCCEKRQEANIATQDIDFEAQHEFPINEEMPRHDVFEIPRGHASERVKHLIRKKRKRRESESEARLWQIYSGDSEDISLS